MNVLAADLTFDSDSHRYFYGGKRVPGVTEVMAPLFHFGMVPAATLEYASDRGTKVHQACHLYVQDDLDEESLDGALRGYVEGFKTFLKVSGFEPIASERRLYSPLGFAGTADLFGRFPSHRKAGVACIDIKTVATLSPATGIQTAAYAQAWDEGVIRSERVRYRYALQLRGDGRYRLHEYTRADDIAAFQGLLAFYRWEQNRGEK